MAAGNLATGFTHGELSTPCAISVSSWPMTLRTTSLGCVTPVRSPWRKRAMAASICPTKPSMRVRPLL